MGARERAHAKKKKKHIIKKQVTKERKYQKSASVPKSKQVQYVGVSKSDLQDGKSQTKVNTKQKNHKSKTENVASYPRNQKVLVVGDGDFGFSAGLVSHRMGGTGVFASSYDSEKSVLGKYGERASRMIKTVREKGGTVVHDVDATNLIETLPKGLQCKKFDRIVFNFPHTGKQRVHLNRMLLHDFFVSAKGFVQENGEIHCTLKNKPPYCGWDIEKQAERAGLVMVDQKRFEFSSFKGYRHVTTEADAKQFDAFEKHCITYCFTVGEHKVDDILV
eukprot:CFRG5388T1